MRLHCQVRTLETIFDVKPKRNGYEPSSTHLSCLGLHGAGAYQHSLSERSVTHPGPRQTQTHNLHFVREHLSTEPTTHKDAVEVVIKHRLCNSVMSGLSLHLQTRSASHLLTNMLIENYATCECLSRLHKPWGHPCAVLAAVCVGCNRVRTCFSQRN